jgi:hypothetical protein
MKTTHDPPNSPDLAPSDCYLFGYVKGHLAGLSVGDADELLKVVEDVLEGIDKDTMQTVFLEWMDRSGKEIATNGDYAN